MRTLKLTIAYDGTAFAGWQSQVGTRTVQGAVEDAFAPLAGTRVVVHAAGRTDAGVHAVGQVVSCALESTIPVAALQRALNVRLPPDVRVLRVEDAAVRFNARFDALAKTYHYDISTAAVLLPQQRLYAWHLPQPLAIAAMQQAAAVLIGEHDFAAFQAAGGEVTSTRRDVSVSQVSAHGDKVRYEVRGSGFLRYMVRNIVGTLVDIGRGRRDAADMTRVLGSRRRETAAATAPPHGLTLWSVDY